MKNVIHKIEDWAQEKIISHESIGGGSIADSKKIKTESGKEYFLKTGAQNPGMFPAEANGLMELERAAVIRIPHVFLADEDFLLIEFIQAGPKVSRFFEDFGRQFARLHRVKGKQFGFKENNFIGHTPQENIPNENQAKDWVTFYYEKRLLFQFKLAEQQNLTSSKLNDGFQLLENKIESILVGRNEPPCLLHGDLWSGNYLADEKGNPVIIDPAVYYGHREADLAMTKLFGGFSSSFYRAYNETYPLEAGFEYRENIYKLYHVLNHLNLFGLGYQRQAVDLLWSYL
ncbi:MAG: fructosamine kinase [Calditrichaeota bacterium]|nr:MAG: fructosamine kinase [Calditrichota bacterium]MBL1207021.1 fructosamine kinase [Calditrichota bacterium]NOG46848.1 phosphotransferase [Calditrichota bacterium]